MTLPMPLSILIFCNLNSHQSMRSFTWLLLINRCQAVTNLGFWSLLLLCCWRMGLKFLLIREKLFFHQISHHAESSSVNLAIGFLSLIFGILISKDEDIVIDSDVYWKEYGVLTISKNFYKGQGVATPMLVLLLLNMLVWLRMRRLSLWG